MGNGGARLLEIVVRIGMVVIVMQVEVLWWWW